MSRDDSFGGIGIVLVGIGGLGAAYLFLRSRPASASGSPREAIWQPASGSTGSPRDPVTRLPDKPFLTIDGERVLIFGDSLSHPGADTGPTVTDIKATATSSSQAISSAPGAVLAAKLLAGVDTGGQRAQAVRINARVGRSARSFLSNEGGLGLIAGDQAFRPTKVIVMLGTNDIDRGTSAIALEQTKDAMRQIRDAYRAMGAEVVAIGPPSYQLDRYTHNAPAVLAAMREVFGTDRTLDARQATLGAGRSGDGVHFTASGAALAGKQLAQALTSAT